MKAITVYECPHCKKLFKTPDRHLCKRNPIFQNCYSCKHWCHQFVIVNRIDGNTNIGPKEACRVNSEYAEDAFLRMIYSEEEPKWTLNCPDYQQL